MLFYVPINGLTITLSYGPTDEEVPGTSTATTHGRALGGNEELGFWRWIYSVWFLLLQNYVTFNCRKTWIKFDMYVQTADALKTIGYVSDFL